MSATCKGCGCTETTPCPGGCGWIAPDMCSSCVLGGLLAKEIAARSDEDGFSADDLPAVAAAFLAHLGIDSELAARLLVGTALGGEVPCALCGQPTHYPPTCLACDREEEAL